MAIRCETGCLPVVSRLVSTPILGFHEPVLPKKVDIVASESVVLDPYVDPPPVRIGVLKFEQDLRDDVNLDARHGRKHLGRW